MRAAVRMRGRGVSHPQADGVPDKESNRFHDSEKDHNLAGLGKRLSSAHAAISVIDREALHPGNEGQRDPGDPEHVLRPPNEGPR
jgi:hypothetical protein